MTNPKFKSDVQSTVVARPQAPQADLSVSGSRSLSSDRVGTTSRRCEDDKSRRPELRSFASGLLASVLLTTISLGAETNREPVRFNRDIRPILSDNCFACHGPDEKARMAELRLDDESGALRDLGGYHAIVPGRPAESELYRRITSADPAERMPPVDSEKTLSDEQIKLIKRWIEQGAQRELHWSLIPPSRPKLPQVDNPPWPRNAVDRFVLARLEREGMEPSFGADKETLLRRITLDLTGLPPTLAEMDAFLADDSSDAYEKVVDRLLASPRYGERMALHWLDLARYADTHGYHTDAGREMWVWRDWVISAFNRNMPFDQFTIEQLAGDLLPNATIQQRVATGFNRNNMVNYEGGIIEEEFRVEYVINRVVTTSTVWLGLTIQCARCHDHKFDPITMRDFYSLFAYFNNVPEKGRDGFEGNAVPVIAIMPAERQQRFDALVNEVQQVEPNLDFARPSDEMDAAQAEWEQEYIALQGGAIWEVLDPVHFSSTGGSKLAELGDGSIIVSGKNPDHDVYEIDLQLDRKGITGVMLVVLADESLPNAGNGRHPGNGDFVLSSFELEIMPADGSGEPQQVRFSDASATYEFPGYPLRGVLDGRNDSGWALGGKGYFIPQAVSAKFFPDEPFGFDGGTKIRVRLRHESSWKQHGIGRFQIAITTAPTAKTAVPDEIAKAMAIPPGNRDVDQKFQLRKFYREQLSPAYIEAQTRFAKLTTELTKLTEGFPTTQVMREMVTPRQAYILERGLYDQHREKVAPATPAVLSQPKEGQPQNRLGLARWLVDPDHPLTARVTVNRFWQMLFGTGIVATPEDFGLQGQWPTHPELLDWLAVEFIESGWDVRSILKTIVMSSTYRQSSRATAELLEKDSDNRLFGRGPRNRLPAEFIRDSALAAGGLLVARIGGPPVMPYQPDGLWNDMNYEPEQYSAQVYNQGRGADLYRRSLYTFWKRTIPPPNMQAFDAPDRESCTVRRNNSNTPLQALVLLNDPTFVEAARGLAQDVISTGGNTSAERITFAFRKAAGRRPTDKESATLVAALDDELQYFDRSPGDAAKLLKVGESPVVEGLEPAEVAAWTNVCSIILNLNETITKE